MWTGLPLSSFLKTCFSCSNHVTGIKLVFVRRGNKTKMAERPQCLSLLSVVISLLILQSSFADEPVGILDQCKESCERSYPLHTYPKVIFRAYKLWSRFMWHCTFVLVDCFSLVVPARKAAMRQFAQRERSYTSRSCFLLSSVLIKR